MNPDALSHRNRNRERDLFLDALDLRDPDAQRAFLLRECRDEPELLRAVGDLLKHHRDDGFLQQAAGVAVLAQVARDRVDPQEGGTSSENLPEFIGPFRLVEKIGEGGCGTVYLAEQQQPVRRRVALKLIRLGMDTPRVIARFEAERQALAMMDHPSIARVLEAGATPQGRPYFVMELVRGVKITEFCERNRLSVAELIRLFIQVCDAVQHAHQKGIIHRDLKPSNVLVTMEGATPVPKVIDFGIAKAIHERLTDRPVVTGFHAFVGTPAYTSPEQAEMSSLDVDTRSDIYSLGVILYELLTGLTPFDPERLSQSGLDEMRRIIREDEPVRPSRRRHAASRGKDGSPESRREEERFGNEMREDLDWVVMKCLEKDRARRYGTVRELALDLQRFLGQEPVTARPPTPGYRLLKFIRRNRTLVTAAGVVGVGLAIATGVSTWQAVRATRAEVEQSRLRIAAEEGQGREVVLLRDAQREREVARRHAYNSDMNLVRQAFDLHNLGRVTDLLNRHLPMEGQPDRRQWEWRYFWDQARSSAQFAFPRQPSRIASITISQNGRLMVTADDSGTLKLWDVPGRREIGTLVEHGKRVRAVAFSPDASLVATVMRQSDDQNQLQIWSTATRQPVRARAIGRGGFGLRFAPDNSKVVFHDLEWRRIEWDIAEGLVRPTQEEFPERNQPGPALWPVISADGRFAVGWDWAGQINLRPLSGDSPARNFPAFGAPPAAWSFSPDGNLLAVSPSFLVEATDILLFDTRSGLPAASLHGNGSWVPAIAFSPDGHLLASAGADQVIRIWDVGSNREVTSLRGHLLEVNALAWGPDGSTLVSGSKDGSLLAWDLRNLEKREPYTSLPGKTRCFAFLGESEGILTVDHSGALHWWDATLHEREHVEGLDGALDAVQVDRTTGRVILGSRQGGIRVIDWATRVTVTNIVASGVNRPGTRFVAQGGKLVVMVPNTSVQVWDMADWTLKASWKLDSRTVPEFVVSPDARRMVVKGDGPGIRFLSLVDGRQENAFVGRSIGRGPMSFSPDGRTFAHGSGEGLVGLRDVGTGEFIDELRGHLNGVHGVCFSPDGQRLVSTSVGRESIKLWDMETRNEVATLAATGGPLADPAFSPDGSWLVAINAQRTACVWRAPTLRQIDADTDSHR